MGKCHVSSGYKKAGHQGQTGDEQTSHQKEGPARAGILIKGFGNVQSALFIRPSAYCEERLRRRFMADAVGDAQLGASQSRA